MNLVDLNRVGLGCRRGSGSSESTYLLSLQEGEFVVVVPLVRRRLSHDGWSFR